MNQSKKKKVVQTLSFPLGDGERRASHVNMGKEMSGEMRVKNKIHQLLHFPQHCTHSWWHQLSPWKMRHPMSSPVTFTGDWSGSAIVDDPPYEGPSWVSASGQTDTDSWRMEDSSHMTSSLCGPICSWQPPLISPANHLFFNYSFGRRKVSVFISFQGPFFSFRDRLSFFTFEDFSSQGVSYRGHIF